VRFNDRSLTVAALIPCHRIMRDSIGCCPVKTGGRLIKHARYYWLLLAESHLTRRLFGSMVRRIASLPLPAG
jgi:hypothetical protein